MTDQPRACLYGLLNCLRVFQAFFFFLYSLTFCLFRFVSKQATRQLLNCKLNFSHHHRRRRRIRRRMSFSNEIRSQKCKETSEHAPGRQVTLPVIGSQV